MGLIKPLKAIKSDFLHLIIGVVFVLDCTFFYCVQTDAKSPKSSTGHSTTKKCEQNSSERLDFSLEQLLAVLKGEPAPLAISVDIAPDTFIGKAKDLTISGCYQKISGKVIGVAVNGLGRPFELTVSKVIDLANLKKSADGKMLKEKMINAIRTQQNPDVFLDRAGTRYHLQKISGRLNFHCTNAGADDRAIIKAQPAI